MRRCSALSTSISPSSVRWEVVTHFELDLDRMTQRMYSSLHWKRLSRVVGVYYMHHLPSNSQRCKFVINLCPSPSRSPPSWTICPCYYDLQYTSLPEVATVPCGSALFTVCLRSHPRGSQLRYAPILNLNPLPHPPISSRGSYIGIRPPIPTAHFRFPN